MELKFLPLGSVCVVKNLNNKQVIIGYKNQGYDYIGVPFPKGFSKNQDINYFNHSDIIELYSYGYKDEESKIFISSLPVELKSVKSEVDNENRLDETVDVVLSPKANGGYLFDENGVVVADKLASEVVAPQDSSSSFDEDEVVASDKKTNNQNDKVEEPRYVFDKNGVVIEDKKESKTSGNYQFDENGIVVADKETNNQNDKVDEPRYVFDENGVVIEDKKESKTLKNYQFDENGVVVADGTEGSTAVEENVDVKFDENGMVILDNEDSIFEDVEAPGVIDEPKDDAFEAVEDEINIEEGKSKKEEVDEVEITDLPDVKEEPKKEDKPKKKKGFFNFGK